MKDTMEDTKKNNAMNATMKDTKKNTMNDAMKDTMKDAMKSNAMKDTMKDAKNNATNNATNNAGGRTNGTTAAAAAALRFAPGLIIMPYCVATMQSDQSRLQLNALIIAMSLLQPWLTAQLNREMTHEEALRLLVASNGAGPDLLHFPITWQAAGTTRCRGMMAIAAATKAPNLGLRIITADDGGDFQLYMTVRMASYLLDLSKGYFYISPQLCHAMRSRYAVRLYWLMQAHSHQGGFTMSIGQLQSIFCPATPQGRYTLFERSVIVQPLATLQKLHAEGKLPSYMLFCRLYNRQGHRYWVSASTALRGFGTPDALKFTIIRPGHAAPASTRATHPAEGPAQASMTEKRERATVIAAAAKTAETVAAAETTETASAATENAETASAAAGSPAERFQQDIVLTLLHEDLQLPEKLAAREAARVTANMRQQFVNYAIMLKEVIDEKRSRKQQLRNQTAYVLACLHRFFEKQEEKEQAMSGEKGQAIAAASEKEQALGTMKPAVLSSGNQEKPKRDGELETEKPKQGNSRKGMGRQTAADETKKNKGRLPAVDETKKDKGRLPAADETKKNKGRLPTADETKKDKGRLPTADETKTDKGRLPAADETKKDKGRLSAADETGENSGKLAQKELHRRWQAFLASYSGKATAALGRARLTGQLRDGFLVSFSTADDEKLYRADFDAVQHAARQALDITCRFQPGLIVGR